MKNPAPKPAAERLADAKRELREIDRRIEAAAEHRRQTLLDGSAKSAAAVSADRDLADLKLLRARLLDQIDLLPERVSQEESAAAWPPTAVLAREKLDQMRQRLGRLKSIKRLDRSAADDAELDALIPGCRAMSKHAEFLETFERNSRAEVA
jgi:hypothetical protein